MLSVKDFKALNIVLSLDEPLSKHCTYGIGGAAKYFAKVNDFNSLSELIKIANEKDIRWFILGSGTNLLISDNGFDGLVINLDGDFKKIEFNNYCVCGAGVLLAKVLEEFKANSYKGFEFATGIPGTVGGAVKMNAGRKDEWLSKQLVSIKLCDSKGNIKDLDAHEMKWGYRTSEIKDDEIVLEATFTFEACKNDEERKAMLDKIEKFKENRNISQPVGKSCGSVFKNPDDLFAGQLIEESGFKGQVIGGAQVSPLHANFIINNGDAKASDVVSLIQEIQKKVYQDRNVKLISELRFLGFSEDVSLF